MKIRLLAILICLCTWLSSEAQVSRLNFRGNEPPPQNNGKGTILREVPSTIQLTFDASDSREPVIDCDAGHCYLAWRDDRDGNEEIYFCVLSPGGIKEFPEINISNSATDSYSPDISVDGAGHAFVAWTEGGVKGALTYAVYDAAGTQLLAPTNVASPNRRGPKLAAFGDGLCNIIYEEANILFKYYVWWGRLDINGNFVCGPTQLLSQLYDTNHMQDVACWSDGSSFSGFIYEEATDYLLLSDFDDNCSGGTLYDQYDISIYLEDQAIAVSPGTYWSVFQERVGTDREIKNWRGANTACSIAPGELGGSAYRPSVGSDGINGFLAWEHRADARSIYVTKFSGCDVLGNQLLSNGVDNAEAPDIFVRQSGVGEYYVVWQDCRNGNWDIYLATTRDSYPWLCILDGSPEPQPLVERECAFYNLSRGKDNEPVGYATTDFAGVVVPEPGWFEKDDVIKVELLAHALPNKRDYHQDVASVHRIILDNAEVQSSGPLLFDTYIDVPGQAVVLDHTTIKYNLLVVVEWDATPSQLQNIVEAFGMVANYLYDVTDGQATLDSIQILDCGEQTRMGPFDNADIQITARDSYSGIVAESAHGYHGQNYLCSYGGVFLPRVIYSTSRSEQSDLIQQLEIDWTTPIVPGFDYSYPGIQGISHELGHYLFYLGEEYARGAECLASVTEYNFGLMDVPLLNSPSQDKFGEMSSEKDYVLAGSNHTDQWCRNGLSCWGSFESLYEIDVWHARSGCWEESTFPRANIVAPHDRGGDELPLPGPNNDLNTPDVDCGANAQIWYEDFDEQGRIIVIKVPDFKNRAPLDTYHALVLKAGNGYIMRQGVLSSDRTLDLLGVNVEDTVMIYSLTEDPTTGQPGFAFGSVPASAAAGDTLYADFSLVPGEHPLVLRATAVEPLAFEINLDFVNPLPSPPLLYVYSSSASPFWEQLAEIGGSYRTSTSVSSGNWGEMLLHVAEQRDDSYAFSADYNWTIAPEEGEVSVAASRSAGCRVKIDTAASDFSAVLICECDYLVPSAGLPDSFAILSPVYSISTHPSGGAIPGSSSGAFAFSEVEAGQSFDDSVSVYRWDSVVGEWQAVSTDVDWDALECYSPLSQEGAYFVAGALIPYICGDADSDGEANITDAVYLIQYIFAGGPAPDPIEKGDFDCGSTVNITDVVYMIQYIFAGGPAPCDPDNNGEPDC